MTKSDSHTFAMPDGWFEDLCRRLWFHFPVHDEPDQRTWACRCCPYFNVGVICTKCGAPRESAPPMFSGVAHG